MEDTLGPEYLKHQAVLHVKQHTIEPILIQTDVPFCKKLPYNVSATAAVKYEDFTSQVIPKTILEGKQQLTWDQLVDGISCEFKLQLCHLTACQGHQAAHARLVLLIKKLHESNVVISAKVTPLTTIYLLPGFDSFKSLIQNGCPDWRLGAMVGVIVWNTEDLTSSSKIISTNVIRKAANIKQEPLDHPIVSSLHGSRDTQFPEPSTRDFLQKTKNHVSRLAQFTEDQPSCLGSPTPEPARSQDEVPAALISPDCDKLLQGLPENPSLIPSVFPDVSLINRTRKSSCSTSQTNSWEGCETPDTNEIRTTESNNQEVLNETGLAPGIEHCLESRQAVAAENHLAGGQGQALSEIQNHPVNACLSSTYVAKRQPAQSDNSEKDFSAVDQISSQGRLASVNKDCERDQENALTDVSVRKFSSKSSKKTTMTHPPSSDSKNSDPKGCTHSDNADIQVNRSPRVVISRITLPTNGTEQIWTSEIRGADINDLKHCQKSQVGDCISNVESVICNSKTDLSTKSKSKSFEKFGSKEMTSAAKKRMSSSERSNDSKQRKKENIEHKPKEKTEDSQRLNANQIVQDDTLLLNETKKLDGSSRRISASDNSAKKPRGRPRKYPPTDQRIESQGVSQSQQGSAHGNASWRIELTNSDATKFNPDKKIERRGRPRKYSTEADFEKNKHKIERRGRPRKYSIEADPVSGKLMNTQLDAQFKHVKQVNQVFQELKANAEKDYSNLMTQFDTSDSKLTNNGSVDSSKVPKVKAFQSDGHSHDAGEKVASALKTIPVKKQAPSSLDNDIFQKSALTPPMAQKTNVSNAGWTTSSIDVQKKLHLGPDMKHGKPDPWFEKSQRPEKRVPDMKHVKQDPRLLKCQKPVPDMKQVPDVKHVKSDPRLERSHNAELKCSQTTSSTSQSTATSPYSSKATPKSQGILKRRSLTPHFVSRDAQTEMTGVDGETQTACHGDNVAVQTELMVTTTETQTSVSQRDISTMTDFDSTGLEWQQPDRQEEKSGDEWAASIGIHNQIVINLLQTVMNCLTTPVSSVLSEARASLGAVCTFLQQQQERETSPDFMPLLTGSSKLLVTLNTAVSQVCTEIADKNLKGENQQEQCTGYDQHEPIEKIMKQELSEEAFPLDSQQIDDAESNNRSPVSKPPLCIRPQETLCSSEFKPSHEDRDLRIPSSKSQHQNSPNSESTHDAKSQECQNIAKPCPQRSPRKTPGPPSLIEKISVPTCEQFARVTPATNKQSSLKSIGKDSPQEYVSSVKQPTTSPPTHPALIQHVVHQTHLHFPQTASRGQLHVDDIPLPAYNSHSVADAAYTTAMASSSQTTWDRKVDQFLGTISTASKKSQSNELSPKHLDNNPEEESGPKSNYTKLMDTGGKNELSGDGSRSIGNDELYDPFCYNQNCGEDQIPGLDICTPKTSDTTSRKGHSELFKLAGYSTNAPANMQRLIKKVDGTYGRNIISRSPERRDTQSSSSSSSYSRRSRSRSRSAKRRHFSTSRSSSRSTSLSSTSTARSSSPSCRSFRNSRRHNARSGKGNRSSRKISSFVRGVYPSRAKSKLETGRSHFSTSAFRLRSRSRSKSRSRSRSPKKNMRKDTK